MNYNLNGVWMLKEFAIFSLHEILFNTLLSDKARIV